MQPLYRTRLPQLSNEIFITDGGIETTLIYLEKQALPSFAAFDLLKDIKGTQAIERYFQSYFDLAKKHDVGLIVETPTWRSSADWGKTLGYSPDALQKANQQAVRLVLDLRAKQKNSKPILVSGCIGPRGDGYQPTRRMSAEEALNYHAEQIHLFAQEGVDFVSALTMNYAEEAIGIARVATAVGMPVVISFTVETDGKLPTGQTLKEAIMSVDQATGTAPIYYMINCAHPTHLNEREMREGVGEGGWAKRLRGFRANASALSHTELDKATELDPGNPTELAEQFKQLRRCWKGLTVLGGCCGTDTRHLAEICKTNLQRSSF